MTTNEKPVMQFEEFQKRRRYGAHDDAALIYGHAPVCYKYPGSFFIQDLGPAEEKRFYLVIMSEDWQSDDLGELEKHLYEHFLSEGAEP